MQKQENGVCQWWARWRHFDCSHCIAGGASLTFSHLVAPDSIPKQWYYGIFFQNWVMWVLFSFLVAVWEKNPICTLGEKTN
jgi:hypothetical protein